MSRQVTEDRSEREAAGFFPRIPSITEHTSGCGSSSALHPSSRKEAVSLRFHLWGSTNSLRGKPLPRPQGMWGAARVLACGGHGGQALERCPEYLVSTHSPLSGHSLREPRNVLRGSAPPMLTKETDYQRWQGRALTGEEGAVHVAVFTAVPEAADAGFTLSEGQAQ